MFASVGNFFSRRRRRQRIVRPLIDTLTAVSVFVAFTALTCHDPLSARTSPAMFAGIERAASPDATTAVANRGQRPVVEIATTQFSTSPNAVYGNTSRSAASTLLGMALSALAALNLILFRHLRRAYAPRRRLMAKR